MIRAGWHLLARRELFEAQDFYESRADGLGDVFLDAVEAAMMRLRTHPRAGSSEKDVLRRSRLARFPYTLIYRISPDRLFILAVAHDKKRPRYWAKRS